MNEQILKSKKFRAAILAAISNILTFCVTQFGWHIDVSQTIALMSAITAPFLIYIGAEGFSEKDAKAVIEENKVKEKINTQVLNSLLKKEIENEKDE